ncbi:D-alanyl-D-alanine carboxypeptidase/D-alanyl-D-alanine-endopeptidase (penicillin-binding protein 4) [Lipingzhangella halophila]|uniref:D-alanyl-D-alanine carboxypeptidase/D-alanyl-D-alanine-endopeptidase (Penicillin-binding protein 4) n=1 Tax=Lipingzhangella halophila TaxID=1783352 RepID=A0A7W7RK76_9ACTN|nr:D-alanyl-D-alanine carboxypeptidase/D-alanyl-D-alanine-endopeptidase [Lipingzhangella halophila]MBB4933490.1 D-alanyl-D-alanine carboxypeptidase/D-alanyl-D-alanine-endopeptidase (penicillin-binding protein 4) [Lipingzhangella halophila]
MPIAPATPRSPSSALGRPTAVLTVAGLTATALLAPLAAPASAADAGSGVDDLRSDLDALLDDPALDGATSGVVVRSLDRGDVLYEHAADTALIPASNMKLLTSVAALDVLGPDHTFDTTVSAAEEPSGGVVEGDLYLTGTGDPSLTSDAFDDLAAEVAGSGVTEVTGDLLADDTWFDTQRLHPDWEADDEPYYYAAQISALTVAANDDLDTGVVNVTASPGGASGDPVEVRLDPAAGNLDLTNEASTGTPGSAAALDVHREPGTNQFTATGSLPAGGTDFSTLRTVHEPTDHAVHVFAGALEDHGVKVRGGVDRGTGPEAPEDAAELASAESAELSELLVPFMKLSNNGHAEILVKAMGRESAGEGSWQAGTAETAAALDRLGAELGEHELSDGSGLARSNQLTANGVAGVLRAALDEPWAADWEDSLPVAGAENRMQGGTLSERMRGTPAEANVRAKTGSLSGVSALSGYVTGNGGEELAFAVLNNGFEGAAPRDVQDAIAVRLAEFSRDTATSGQPDPLAQRAPERDAAGELECTWAGTC